MRKNITGLLVVALFAFASGVMADGEHIDWQVISPGGTMEMNSPTLHSGATVGQISVGTSTSLTVTCLTGFWQDFGLEGGGGCCTGRVGDANMAGGDEPTLGDVTTMISAKFIEGTCVGILNCMTEADINRSGGLTATCDDISLGDITTLIDYLFITGQSLGLPDCL